MKKRRVYSFIQLAFSITLTILNHFHFLQVQSQNQTLREEIKGQIKTKIKAQERKKKKIKEHLIKQNSEFNSFQFLPLPPPFSFVFFFYFLLLLFLFSFLFFFFFSLYFLLLHPPLPNIFLFVPLPICNHLLFPLLNL